MQCVTNRRLVTRFVNSCIQLISTDRLTHCGAHTPRLSRSGLLRRLELVLRHGFLLDRLPAVIRSKRSYPAMPLAGQLADQRFTIPGPLVQRNDSLNSLPPPALPILSHCLQCYGQSLIGQRIGNRRGHTPREDRNRTASRRTKPNSRTALIGEQPNPWDLLQPQDAMSRHRGAKRLRRYGLLGVISLLSLAYL